MTIAPPQNVGGGQIRAALVLASGDADGALAVLRPLLLRPEAVRGLDDPAPALAAAIGLQAAALARHVGAWPLLIRIESGVDEPAATLQEWAVDAVGRVHGEDDAREAHAKAFANEGKKKESRLRARKERFDCSSSDNDSSCE